MRDPSKAEDARNVSLISGSGLLALLITLGLVWGYNATKDDPVFTPLTELRPATVSTGAFEGNERLFGHVVSNRGTYQGFIRWDRNEGSWADVLDATKADRLSGIRFGHISRIEVMGRRGARFTLKTGEEVDLGSHSTDLGSGLRALVVDDPVLGRQEFRWRDLEVIEFEAAPNDARAAETRLYGTMTTRAGLDFTGYVAWDVDEIYSTDVLDGDNGDGDVQIPFGSIASIERHSGSAARVTLRTGEEMVLRGTNDVNRSNGGISVSVPALGQVKVGWDDFVAVRFDEEPRQLGYHAYDGGQRLVGTVTTTDGERLSGAIRWDRDEAFGWEMLNGDYRGIEFSVEFGQIWKIEKTERGAAVTLKDGQTFELAGSNDVGSGNGGIEIQDDDLDRRVRWRDFVSLEFMD